MAMKLDHEDLNRLIDKISTSDIQEFSLEGEDFKLEIKHGQMYNLVLNYFRYDLCFNDKLYIVDLLVINFCNSKLLNFITRGLFLLFLILFINVSFFQSSHTEIHFF